MAVFSPGQAVCFLNSIVQIYVCIWWHRSIASERSVCVKWIADNSNSNHEVCSTLNWSTPLGFHWFTGRIQALFQRNNGYLTAIFFVMPITVFIETHIFKIDVCINYATNNFCNLVRTTQWCSGRCKENNSSSCSLEGLDRILFPFTLSTIS
jgi:hypothetical protein